MIPATISVFITLAVLAGIALTRERGDRRPAAPGGPHDDGPLRVLDEAFASGEIDLTQYQARRARLRKAQRTG